MSGPSVAVVGGGLAGLAAAIECAQSGASVTLYEARPRLGGETVSFERNGLWLDNGQHVALRCCSAYLEFLERIGSAQLLPLQRSPTRGKNPRSTKWINGSSSHSRNLCGSSTPCVPGRRRITRGTISASTNDAAIITTTAPTPAIADRSPAANGLRTILNYQQIGTVKYFDAAGFPGRTVGLDAAAVLGN